jgi:prephenate dehydrogenase
MSEKSTIAIVGLGLIGGSLARDLHSLGYRILGGDADRATLRDALREGIIHDALPEDLAGVEAAAIVVLAVPVTAAPGLLRALAPRLRAVLVTDVGSTKRSILEAALTAGPSLRFIGSHPLAGDHGSGWAASRTELFLDRSVFLCPAPGSGRQALEQALALWRAVGARPVLDEASAHDARMAWLSHLPQAAASALASAIAGSGLHAAGLGPGGRDATRLAASSAELWAGILLDNADRVEPALAALEGSIAALRTALHQRDLPRLAHLLAVAKRWRDEG